MPDVPSLLEAVIGVVIDLEDDLLRLMVARIDHRLFLGDIVATHLADVPPDPLLGLTMRLFAHDRQQRFFDSLGIEEERPSPFRCSANFARLRTIIDGSGTVGREALVDVVLLAVQEEVHRRGGLSRAGVDVGVFGLGLARRCVLLTLLKSAVEGGDDLLAGGDGLVGRLLDVVDALGFDVTVVIQLRAEGNALPDTTNWLRNFEQMTNVYEVAGDYDMVAIGRFRDTDEMNDQIKALLADSDIHQSNTSVVLNAVTENEQFELEIRDI